MKKITVICLALLLMVYIIGCNKENKNDSSNLSTEKNWGIKLEVKDISPDRLTLVISQSGGNPTGRLQYGSEYSLEVLNNEAWEIVPFAVDGDVAWTSVAYMVEMDGESEQTVLFENLYGSLDAGTYRIIKGFTDFRKTGDYDYLNYSVEFEVE